MKMNLQVMCSLTLLTAGLTVSAAEKYFWQITDFHYDPSYMTSQDSCNDNIDSKAHPYGDFECDSPWLLVESSIKSLRTLGSSPTFILWTGDVAPHAKNRASMSEEILLVLLRNTTALIRETFPGVPVYVTLGNHDYYPASQLPGHGCKLYNETARRIWRDWLGTDENVETFAKGGYYTTLMLEVGPNVRAVVINTNLYYKNNKVTITTGDQDPAGQFVWLNHTLAQARINGEKVHLIMHIPPGILEGTDDARWLTENTNKRFHMILRTYADIMLGMYAGHQHQDSFRIIHDFENNSRGVILIAPSVTPWRARIAGGIIRTAARNPGIRQIFFDSDTGALLDVKQFYMSLTDANDLQAGQSPTWTLLYSFKEAYGVADVSAGTLSALLADFKTSNSSKFGNYYNWNTVASHQPSNKPCNCYCRFMHTCAIDFVDYNDNKACLKQSPCSGPSAKRGSLAISLATILFVYFVMTRQCSGGASL